MTKEDSAMLDENCNYMYPILVSTVGKILKNPGKMKSETPKKIFCFLLAWVLKSSPKLVWKSDKKMCGVTMVTPNFGKFHWKYKGREMTALYALSFIEKKTDYFTLKCAWLALTCLCVIHLIGAVTLLVSKNLSVYPARYFMVAKMDDGVLRKRKKMYRKLENLTQSGHIF